jgi:two-component system sensor histidine kinase YesM
MKNEIGRTILQLVNQNHVTLEKTLSSVNDKTVTFLDNHFFSDPKQYKFWTEIESLSDISVADSILERWSADGTEYSLYMNNLAGKNPPIELSYKTKGFKYFNEDNTGLPEGTSSILDEKGGGTLRLLTGNEGNSTVSYMRSILNPKSYDEVIGLLVVSKLEILLTKDLVSVQLPRNAGIYLFNDDNQLLMKAGSKESTMTEIPAGAIRNSADYFFAKEDSGKWLIAYSRKSTFNTSLVYKIPLDSITGNQTAFQLTMMIVSAVYLVFVLVFVLYLLRIVVKPLLKLVSITKIYEPGKRLDLDENLLRTDEFGLLYGAFLRMTKRLDVSVEENYVMKIRHKENELTMLHSQITPHLLYNTLDSIYWYALDSGNKDVGEMVKDLSKLLRIGLSKGRTIITIQEEVEHARAYSRLQMKRYPNTFEVIWDIDEEVTVYMTPKVIMQPLIENAIFHGVSSMDGEGIIWVRIQRVDDHIVMMIEDNGFLPVDMERLDHIIKGEAVDKGYGIRNVHQRIQLHYGEAYGLRYEWRESGGIRAIITFPKQENSELKR